jgi:hypothetical protein
VILDLHHLPRSITVIYHLMRDARARKEKREHIVEREYVSVHPPACPEGHPRSESM